MSAMTHSMLLAFVVGLAALARALPLSVRDVIDPPITSPTAGTVWAVGSTQTVTWSISGLNLSAATNPDGMLVLGFSENDSENLMLDSPLAQGFLLNATDVQITVPDVPTRSDYILVLFGDSGNASPEFTIQGSSSNSGSPSSSSSDSVTPTSTASTPSSTVTQPTSSSSATPESALGGSSSSTSSADQSSSSSISSSLSSVSSSVSSALSSQSSVASSLSSAASSSASSLSGSQPSPTGATSAASATHVAHLTMLLMAVITAVFIS